MKAPAFQFYPGDYLASQRVSLMTLEEEGAYIRLLCYCWQSGSIPSDPERIARLIGKGASTTLATNVAAMFQPSDKPGELVNDRLDQERTKQQRWREKSANGGKKSAEKRAESKGASTTLDTVVEGSLKNGSHQSPTLQSSVFSLQTSVKTEAEPELPFKSEEFKAAWTMFEKHRREIKRPLKPTATAMSLKMLAGIGEERAIRCIEHTITKGWQGLREPDAKDLSAGREKSEWAKRFDGELL